MERTRFVKGHGTLNDFILIGDPDGFVQLTPEFVRWVTDRRAGVGADGLIRAVRAGAIAEWDGDPDLWFMDYHNADGSVAEMCGNGLRVFAAYLLHEQLVDSPSFDVATRAGVRHVDVHARGIRIGLGRAFVDSESVTVRLGERTWPGVPVDVGNPHAVVFLSAEELAGLDLHEAPTCEPAERFPNGVNVEFVVVGDTNELTMRVHERGVGETMSCGTGVVAAAAAYRALHAADGEAVQVHVPGGDLEVEFQESGVSLNGPAVLVSEGQLLN